MGESTTLPCALYIRCGLHLRSFARNYDMKILLFNSLNIKVCLLKMHALWLSGASDNDDNAIVKCGGLGLN
jgi:hypothetical protein